MNDDLAKKLEFLENNYRHKALFLILMSIPLIEDHSLR